MNTKEELVTAPDFAHARNERKERREEEKSVLLFSRRREVLPKCAFLALKNHSRKVAITCISARPALGIVDRSPSSAISVSRDISGARRESVIQYLERAADVNFSVNGIWTSCTIL